MERRQNYFNGGVRMIITSEYLERIDVAMEVIIQKFVDDDDFDALIDSIPIEKKIDFIEDYNKEVEDKQTVLNLE